MDLGNTFNSGPWVIATQFKADLISQLLSDYLVLFSFVFLYYGFIAHRVLSPYATHIKTLNRIREAIVNITNYKFNHSISLEGNNEFSDLAAAVNRMVHVWVSN